MSELPQQASNKDVSVSGTQERLAVFLSDLDGLSSKLDLIKGNRDAVKQALQGLHGILLESLSHEISTIRKRFTTFMKSTDFAEPSNEKEDLSPTNEKDDEALKNEQWFIQLANQLAECSKKVWYLINREQLAVLPNASATHRNIGHQLFEVSQQLGQLGELIDAENFERLPEKDKQHFRMDELCAILREDKKKTRKSTDKMDPVACAKFFKEAIDLFTVLNPEQSKEDAIKFITLRTRIKGEDIRSHLILLGLPAELRKSIANLRLTLNSAMVLVNRAQGLEGVDNFPLLISLLKAKQAMMKSSINSKTVDNVLDAFLEGRGEALLAKLQKPKEDVPKKRGKVEKKIVELPYYAKRRTECQVKERASSCPGIAGDTVHTIPGTQTNVELYRQHDCKIGGEIILVELKRGGRALVTKAHIDDLRPVEKQ